MSPRLAPLAVVLCAMLLLPRATPAQAAARVPVKLWRLDCGQILETDLDLFSDTFAYVGQHKLLPVSCYLVQHGDAYMLWDAGLSRAVLGKPLTGEGSTGESLRTTIVDQLERIGVRPAQVTTLGISHYHYDHTGQAGDFGDATLLMGAGDIAALRTPDNERARPLARWISGGGAVTPLTGDHDVFGDGSVVMLDLPGHTPGHHGLLVRLPQTGAVLLSGDVAHFRENLLSRGVPRFNVDRAASLASMDRFSAIGRRLHARLIIQHETGDVAKLPAFPAFAR